MWQQEIGAKAFQRPKHSQYANTAKLNSGVIKLPKTAELASLFASMTPYFDPKVNPAADLMQLKLQEGLLALLHIDKKFAPMLFDLSLIHILMNKSKFPFRSLANAICLPSGDQTGLAS